MSWSASIRIVDDDGDGVEGARVSIHFFGLVGGHLIEYTDEDGWAFFEIDSASSSSKNVETIYVNGEEVDSGLTIDDEETLSYSI